MSKKTQSTDNPWKYRAPGEPLKQWTKKRPVPERIEQTKRTRILKPGEQMPFGPGRPGYGNAR